MTIQGNLLSLTKSLGNRSHLLREQTRERTVDTHDKLHGDKIVVIEVLNTEAGNITFNPGDCVSVFAGSNSINEIDYPSITDDPESTIYGAVLDEIIPGQIGHVQISGKALLNVYNESGNPGYNVSNNITVGDTIYALDNVAGKSGLVQNKFSNDTDLISKIPIGKALTPQDTDSTTIVVNLSVAGGAAAASLVITADVASTVSLIYPFTAPMVSIDSFTLVDKTIVLMKDQITQSQNGLWQYVKDPITSVFSWKRIGTLIGGMLITVRHGTLGVGVYELVTDDVITAGTTALDFEFISSPSVWVDLGVTTANIALSGIGSVDGSSPAGKKVLVWKQSGALIAQNGIYKVSAGGVWTYMGQPKVVYIASGSTYGQGWFIWSSINIYKQGAGFNT